MLATAGYLLRFPLKSQGVRVKFWEFREIPVLFMTLASYLEVFPGFPPSVPDPSGGKRTFDHRWDSLGYPAFAPASFSMHANWLPPITSQTQIGVLPSGKMFSGLATR
jgi:hypothetical protein